MKIAVLADTHDNLDNTQAAASVFTQENINVILHCGDVCGPDVIEALTGFTVHLAQGNMDRMPALGMSVEALQGRGRLARYHDLILDGFRIALLHGDDDGLLHRLVDSGAYAYVFHGHTHRRADRWVGPTRVINPGALGGTRYEARSACIVDIKAGQARFVHIPDADNGKGT